MSNVKPDTIQIDVTCKMECKKCPVCTQGIMRMMHNRPPIMTHPIKYTHQCDLCFAEESYVEIYPRIIYVEEEPTNE